MNTKIALASCLCLSLPDNGWGNFLVIMWIWVKIILPHKSKQVLPLKQVEKTTWSPCIWMTQVCPMLKLSFIVGIYNKDSLKWTGILNLYSPEVPQLYHRKILGGRKRCNPQPQWGCLWGVMFKTKVLMTEGFLRSDTNESTDSLQYSEGPFPWSLGASVSFGKDTSKLTWLNSSSWIDYRWFSKKTIIQTQEVGMELFMLMCPIMLCGAKETETPGTPIPGQ